VIVLGLETSCDEPAAAVVRHGREALSNVVYSQIKLHRAYGGVVPEIASRKHVEILPHVLKQAMDEAKIGWNDLDAIAVTQGPGLASSLLVGLSAAKGLALRLGIPLIGINHLEGHLFSAFIGPEAPVLDEQCPFTALIVSGGHTTLLRVLGAGRYRVLGSTIDDAAGEAFDKGSNLLGLGYPGGPAIDKASRGGNPDAVPFPRGKQKGEIFSFSFSGLKTSLLYYLRQHPVTPGDTARLADVAASYQEAIVDALVDRTLLAARDGRPVAVVGGVSMNKRLREKLTSCSNEKGFRLMLSAPAFCTDNAAMIAAVADHGLGLKGRDALDMDCEPRLELNFLTD
jgi:N6-L-threonylcarbamoyladenine synthase